MPAKRKRKGAKKSTSSAPPAATATSTSAANQHQPEPATEPTPQEHTNGFIPNGTASPPPPPPTTIPPVVKTITPITIDLVRFDTTLPYAEIMARLEAEINKAGSDDIMSHLRRTNTQDEFQVVIQKFKPGEFLYFSEYPHQRILQFKDGIKKPACHVYNFGNPMLAQRILAHNPLAGYSIPPRFLITENDDFTGCTVSYHRASDVMGLVDGLKDPKLEEELRFLDGKLEALATRITAVQTPHL